MIQKRLNKIILGETVEVLKSFPDESIDLIFADPPYFMQTEGELFRNDGSKFSGVEEQWDKFDGYKEYDSFCYNWLKECKRVLKNDGSIWVIGSFQNIYRIGYIMQNLDFWILNDIVWAKPNAVPNFGGTRFQNSHETLLWCTKNKKSKYTFNYKTMKHLNGEKQEKSVWNISICIGNERIKGEDGKKVHSTQKPEKLLEKIILSSSKPNDIILDPFFGTGTTGAIAKRYGRNFIGIEREENYIKIAEERILKEKNISNDISNLTLEKKPPKVQMKTLVEKGYILENQALFNSKKEEVCKVCKDGKVIDNEEKLSIHKMSAKILKKINNNGWDYFYIYFENQFLSINELRYKYKERENNE